jgi:Tol biopolymer transport system component
MEAVWPDTAVEENNLTQNISTLRKLLGDSSNGQAFIETVPKRGYRFVAEVQHLPPPQQEFLLERRTRWSYVTEEEEEETSGPDIIDIGAQHPPTPAMTVDRESVQAPAARSAVRHRTVAIGVIAVGIGIVAVVALGRAILSRQEPSPRDRFQEMTIARLTSSGNVIAGAISPDGKYVVHAISEAGLQSLWVKQIPTGSNIQIVPPAPIDYWGVTLSPDSNFVYCATWERNKADPVLFRVPILGGLRRDLAHGIDGAVSFSPDAQRLAFGRGQPSKGQSQLMTANADGTDPQVFARSSGGALFGGDPTGPAWSPDGQVIVSGLGRTVSGYRQQRLVQLNLSDGQQRQIGSQTWFNMGRIAWLADGSGLVFSARDGAESPGQIWLVRYPEGETTRVTNDLHDYSHVNATVDGRTLAAVQTQTVSSLWLAAAEDPTRAREVLSEVGSYSGLEGLSWTPDGKLVYRSKAAGRIDLWVMDSDGGGRRQLTSDGGNNFHPAVSSDGRFIAFTSDRSGQLSLWQMTTSGGQVKQLTRGVDDVRPQVSADGQWIVFQQGHGPTKMTLWKAPAHGGDPVQLTNTMSMRPAVSRDGQLIAYYYMDAERWGLAVMPLTGGPPVARFDIPPTSGTRVVQWIPNRRALAYLDEREGVSNIWMQPLDGGPPQQSGAGDSTRRSGTARVPGLRVSGS